MLHRGPSQGHTGQLAPRTSFSPHLTPSSECLSGCQVFFSPRNEQFLLKGMQYLCLGDYDFISAVRRTTVKESE